MVCNVNLYISNLLFHSNLLCHDHVFKMQQKGVKNVYNEFQFIMSPLPFGDWFDVELSEMLAADVDWPTNIPDGSEMYNDVLQKYDRIWNEVAPSIERTKDLMKQRIEQVAEDLKLQTDLVVDIASIPNILPKDYNPPPFTGATGLNSTIDTEESKHVNASKVRG